MREVVFDTETTGLSPKDGDRVIEIGAMELVNRFPTGKTFHVYINPEDRAVDPGAYEIHEISNEFLADKPKFADILDDFLAFFGEGHLIAHNAAFDIGFLNAEMQRLGQPPFPDERVIDTLQIARRKHPGAKNSLDALCARYAINNSHRDLHGALVDTELLVQVYLELTGGRQAGLGLLDEDNDTSSLTIAGSSHPPQRQRPEPLASRLTAAEKAAHEAFVDEIGETAIWRKVLAGS